MPRFQIETITCTHREQQRFPPSNGAAAGALLSVVAGFVHGDLLPRLRWRLMKRRPENGCTKGTRVTMDLRVGASHIAFGALGPASPGALLFNSWACGLLFSDKKMTWHATRASRSRLTDTATDRLIATARQQGECSFRWESRDWRPGASVI